MADCARRDPMDRGESQRGSRPRGVSATIWRAKGLVAGVETRRAGVRLPTRGRAHAERPCRCRPFRRQRSLENHCENHNRSSCRRGARRRLLVSGLARTRDGRRVVTTDLPGSGVSQWDIGSRSTGLLGLEMGLSASPRASEASRAGSPGLVRPSSAPQGRRYARSGRRPVYGDRITSLLSPPAGVDRTGHRQWAGGALSPPARRSRSQRSGRRCGCVAQGSRSSCASSGGSPRKSSPSSNQARRRVFEDWNICSRP